MHRREAAWATSSATTKPCSRERDLWAKRGQITHQTEPYYQEGLKAFQEAEQHWDQGNSLLERAATLWDDEKDEESFRACRDAITEFNAAIPLYEEARTQLGKVSNRTR